jgi:predicted membrane-bound mannosyltransferase
MSDATHGSSSGGETELSCKKGNVVSDGKPVTLSNILKSPAVQFPLLYLTAAVSVRTIVCFVDDIVVPLITSYTSDRRLEEHAVVLKAGDSSYVEKLRSPITLNYGRFMRSLIELIVTIVFVVVALRWLTEYRCQ